MSKEPVRLIDANALKKRAVKVMFRDTSEIGEFYAVGTCDIDIIPTIDPETLRPTAHWINEDSFYKDSIVRSCSECKGKIVMHGGTPENENYQYCPHCGARMVNANEQDNKNH